MKIEKACSSETFANMYLTSWSNISDLYNLGLSTVVLTITSHASVNLRCTLQNMKSWGGIIFCGIVHTLSADTQRRLHQIIPDLILSEISLRRFLNT
jgi:hypothetical protein